MINRFFDSDAAWYFENFVTGDQRFGSYGGRNAVHPNIANLIHPLVIVLHKLIQPFWEGSDYEGLEIAALAIAPLSAAFRTAFLLLTLAAAGLSLFDSTLGATLGTVCFSSVLFGALPESFGLSSALFAAVAYLTIRSAVSRKLSRACWILVGTLIMSTTITNAVPFFGVIIVVAFFLDCNYRLSVLQALRLSFISGLLTLLLFLTLTALHGSFRGVGRKIGQLEEVQINFTSLLWTFPKTILNTLVAPRPAEMIGIDEERETQTIRVVRFTFRNDLQRLRGEVKTIASYRLVPLNLTLESAVAFLLLSAGYLSYSYVLEDVPAARLLWMTNALQLAFHWILHAFFGRELYLYSQHWLVPITILLTLGLARRNVR